MNKEDLKKQKQMKHKKIYLQQWKKLKITEKEYKEELEPIKIEHANEIQINDDKKCILILISTK